MDEMHVRVRLQAVFQKSILKAVSWDNQPLLTMQLSVKRNEMNAAHHNLLAQANHFRFCLVGCYNLLNNDNDATVYTAASKSPMFNRMVKLIVLIIIYNKLFPEYHVNKYCFGLLFNHVKKAKVLKSSLIYIY